MKKNKKKMTMAVTPEKEEASFDLSNKQESGSLNQGVRVLKDVFAPSRISQPAPDHLVVGNKFVRSYSLQGYPLNVYVKWLDELFNYSGNMDTIVNVEPADDRKALDDLTRKITQYQAQLMIEQEKGSITSVSELRNKIQFLYSEREKLELNIESFYHVAIQSNLFADNLEQLNKESQSLENNLKGRRIDFMPSYLRMLEGFKTAMPLSKVFLKDKTRNLNTGALVACFPFYNSEMSHPNGVFIGTNRMTNTPVYIDFYDDKVINNTNVAVFGKSGSGKTFFVSLLTMRSVLKGVRTVILDPEAEYTNFTKVLGGSVVDISPESKNRLNIFDIEEEVEIDDFKRPTGRSSVDVKNKVSDLLNLISVMYPDMNSEERALVSVVLQSLYADFGITTDPKSLYYSEDYFDEKAGELYMTGKKKIMPTFSDFFDKLSSVASTHPDKQGLAKIVNALVIYKKGGIYDMFDCYSTVDSSIFTSAPLITFDVHKLESKILRPIGMYVALSWTMEKFVKKNPKVRKRVVADEAWMLVDKNMAGYEYTASFLETCARRIRKRNGGLLVASQNFIEFMSSEQGRAVLTNTAVRILLKQSSMDIDGVKDVFKLTDGESNFLLGASTGEMLIKTEDESCIAYAMPFEYEANLIKSAKTKKE